MQLRILTAVQLVMAASWSLLGADSGDAAGAGERIYRQRCASCHGESGEGVAEKHAEPLAGDKSLEQLARYIAKSMPEDSPGTCTGEDAELVARYIHESFYSAIARARNQAVRVELSRLTVRQYRNAVLDLVGSFRGVPARGSDRDRPGRQHGLRGEYFDSGRPGRNAVLDRIDPQVRFAFGPPAAEGEEIAKLGPKGFTVRWDGSLHAPDTGVYELILRTGHAARLWLNDSETPLIDAWVKSGSDTEYRASMFLIAGRSYQLKIEFTSRKQGVQDKKDDKKKDDSKPVEAFIELHWKPPGLATEVIPPRHLSPERAPELFVVETPFPPDDRSIGYERGSSISRSWDEATTSAAIETAGYIAAHLGELAGVRERSPEREIAVHRFCERLVERAFRRPLADAERRIYIDNQRGGAPDQETGVKRVVLLALKSPRFLYLDLHGGQPDAYSAASRLSFALWDSLPDQELLEAAAAGRLYSREQIARQAERMLDDSRARSKMRQFLYQWLQIEPVPELAKDAKRFPEFGESMASDLRTSLDLFLEETVWGEGSDFRRLFLSNDLYLNGRAGRYYGFDLAADAPFQKLSAERSQRAGVLTHPYLMARFAYTDSSSPIHRGVFLIRSVLGRALRPPPEAFTPLAPDLHPDLTTRERVALQTQPKPCQGCHGMINALGFTMERFDAAGRYREEEKGRPIDDSGSYEPSSGETLSSGESLAFHGARELAEFLASSEEAQRAFAVKLFHHLVKQPVFAYGKESPEALHQAFAAGNFNIRKLIVEIAATSVLAGIDEFAGSPLPIPPALRQGKSARKTPEPDAGAPPDRLRRF